MIPNDRYNSLFQFYAERYNGDWLKLKAQGRAESNLKPDAVSHVGAMGIMQFMPPTFDEWQMKLQIKHADPYNPEHSIWCGAAYMEWLLARFDGDYRDAWAAYNWGIGHVRKFKEINPDGWWVAHAPKETRDYVERIESYLV